MANKVAAAALQYSKKLSKFICWVWAIYRFSILIVAAIQPSVAGDVAATIPGMDTIMMINISCYLCNSLGEKILYSDKFVLKWLEKEGFKHLLGSVLNKKQTEIAENLEEEIEEGENG